MTRGREQSTEIVDVIFPEGLPQAGHGSAKICMCVSVSRLLRMAPRRSLEDCSLFKGTTGGASTEGRTSERRRDQGKTIEARDSFRMIGVVLESRAACVEGAERGDEDAMSRCRERTRLELWPPRLVDDGMKTGSEG